MFIILATSLTWTIKSLKQETNFCNCEEISQQSNFENFIFTQQNLLNPGASRGLRLLAPARVLLPA